MGQVGHPHHYRATSVPNLIYQCGAYGTFLDFIDINYIDTMICSRFVSQNGNNLPAIILYRMDALRIMRYE